MGETRSRGLPGICLNDHLAAAAGGVGPARGGAQGHGRSQHAKRLRRPADDLAADRRAPLSIVRSLGSPVRRYKSLAVWTAEKGGRLELNGGLLHRSPLCDLVELEALSLEVERRSAGWRTLLAVADGEPGLETGRSRMLLARADDQRAVLGQLRNAAVGEAGAAESATVRPQ